MRQSPNSQARGRVLVADDEQGMRVALKDVLCRAGWEVEAVSNAEQAHELLDAGAHFDLLMTDFRMGEMNGLELARAARMLRPGMPIIMMTAYGTIEDAVAAMKEGVDDYLLKPFSFNTVIEVIERVTRSKRNHRPAAQPERKTATGALRSKTFEKKVVGGHETWRRILSIAEDVAESTATVLLTGESGTGKEVVARYVHELSRRKGPFIAINCAALPEGVLESELFGHEKGAFTGAVLSRKGKFELADGGTILLDEVSEMPLSLQAKLLRVLQEREVTRIGGSTSLELDIRVIATTNRDIEAYTRDGHFRQDLYYRLNVIAIPLPPLRDRGDDVIEFAQYFLRKFLRPDSPVQTFSDEVLRFFLGYDWPGNVRELENMVERATLLARGSEILTTDLHLDIGSLEARSSTRTEDFSQCAAAPERLRFSAGQTLEDVERELILQTLERNNGNRTRTADDLGISVRTIRNKLNQYDHAGLTPAGETA